MSRAIGREWIVAAFLLVLCPSAAAPAQPGPPGMDQQVAKDRRRANVLYQGANRLNERGMYGPALKLYHQARRLYPSYKIDLNIGGVLDAMGRLTDAAAYFHRFLVNSTEAPEQIIEIARERLDELKEKTASVIVGGLVEGAAIKIDGVTRGLTPLVIPIYVTAGNHPVEVQKPGFASYKTKVSLKAGRHIRLKLPLNSSFIKKESIPEPKKCPAAQPRPAPPGLKISRGKTIGAWVATGLGAALIVSGAVLHGVGTTQGNDAYELYMAATAPEEIRNHWDDVESNRTKVIAGQVLLGAAVAAAGTAIYLFATRTAKEASGKVTLSPGVGGASLHIRF